MSNSPFRTLSVVATATLSVAILLLSINGDLFSLSPLVITCQVAALLFSAWARVTLGIRSFHVAANPTPGGLVTTGPYRFVRNPIYAAVWLFTWAGIAAHLGVTSAGLGLLIFSSLIVRILCEERLLRERFPEYPTYARKTARLVPFVV